MLFVIEVFSFINSAISPLELTSAMHFVVLPVAFIFGSVGPLEHAFAVLLAPQVVSAVERAIWPLLSAEPLLLIFMPATFVGGALRVEVLSLTMGFVVNPLALVDVTIGKNEAPVP
jgi:hypothetical protein